MTSKSKHCYSFLVKSALFAADKHGINHRDLLANTDLTEAIFDDPYHLISQQQELTIYRNLLELSDDPSIGLDVGLLCRVSDLGAAGHSMMAAATIREVFKGNQKRTPMLYPHLHWQPLLLGEDVVHRLTETAPLGELRQFMIDRLSALIHIIAQELIGPECLPTRVTFDFSKPSYWQRYKTLFRCPVLFEQPTNEIHYSVKFLDQPIASHDPKVQEVLDGLSDTLLSKLQTESDIITDVTLILREKPGVFPNIDSVAEKLDMSSRTLRRHLTNQDTTFQELLNRVRQDVAEEYLRHSDLNVQQIAEICGFSDAQNFSQAFKRWTGSTPSNFRHHPTSDSQSKSSRSK